MSEHEELRPEPLPVDNIVEKLIDASKVIQHRMGLKLAEEKRVHEAFTLLANGLPSANSKGAKQREVYLDFLQRVQKVVGLSKVVLCAAGLGPSAVANMRDRVRVDLPFKIREREDAFESEIPQSLANAYSAKCEFSTLLSPCRKAELRKCWCRNIATLHQKLSDRRLLISL